MCSNRQAFSRSKALAANVSALLATGLTMMSALMQAGADKYASRGKGRNKRGKMTRSNYYRSCNHYPFSSARQDARAERQYSKMMPNGHVVMQTRSREDQMWSDHNRIWNINHETN